MKQQQFGMDGEKSLESRGIATESPGLGMEQALATGVLIFTISLAFAICSCYKTLAPVQHGPQPVEELRPCSDHPSVEGLSIL
jgi:hypothetical protein